MAMVGIALTVLMVAAERRWQRTGDRMIPPDLTIRAAAAPRITLVLSLWVSARAPSCSSRR